LPRASSGVSSAAEASLSPLAEALARLALAWWGSQGVAGKSRASLEQTQQLHKKPAAASPEDTEAEEVRNARAQPSETA
jgi:hypothetical protein